MARIVSLPMYAAPDDAVEAFWRGLRGHLRRAGLADVPDSLTAPDDFDAHWTAPELLLSQTCGYPLTTYLAGRVQYVGTPHYRAAGCRGPLYSSAVVVRADDPATTVVDLRGRRAAVNGRASHSGYNAVRALVSPLAEGKPFFAAVQETGSHRASALAVRDGIADVAALDAVTFALLQRDRWDETAALRVIAYTAPAPGLPLITGLAASRDEIEALRTAWRAACEDPDLAHARAMLLTDGFSVLTPQDYAAIPAMEAMAAGHGYPVLA